MRVLLDTHVVLWLATSPTKLSADALALAQNARHELLLSTASAWEISVKWASGKLPLPAPPLEFVPELQRRLALTVLPIDLAHVLRAGVLPLLHRDPYDRMLVAQAQILGVPILTVDPKLSLYPVEIISG